MRKSLLSIPRSMLVILFVPFAKRNWYDFKFSQASIYLIQRKLTNNYSIEEFPGLVVNGINLCETFDFPGIR